MTQILNEKIAKGRDNLRGFVCENSRTFGFGRKFSSMSADNLYAGVDLDEGKFEKILLRNGGWGGGGNEIL